ncbi:retron Ec48 family effector membrane protein [Pseudohongiella sp.]|uniref:Uncharacterized protein n=1 Tax=marine sediment metagenome TaxID=412755 RepID=A0A0F9WH44_9ZZZZ|nr:retron Ec48 family effector membrane protein [Pseudohongiella sp.]HDZ09003.1 hypothetical protein [Pseudohongiella sp.]HEA62688.1 hypothetical protein [Pseudohongiella sp.]
MKISFYSLAVYIALLGLFLLAFISFISDYKIYKDTIGDLCFSSDCIDNFYKYFSGSVNIVTGGVAVIAFVAAIFGSIIALDNYRASVKASALSGHINHLKLFQSYIEAESLKFGINFVESVDTFLWYRTMFPDSRKGDVHVSKKYGQLIENLRSEIEKSSNSISNSNANYVPTVVESKSAYNIAAEVVRNSRLKIKQLVGSSQSPIRDKRYTFTNSDHQRRVIASLSEIGVSISRNEQNEFIKTESSALRLIESVNLTFCDLNSSNADLVTLKVERTYL